MCGGWCWILLLHSMAHAEQNRIEFILLNHRIVQSESESRIIYKYRKFGSSHSNPFLSWRSWLDQFNIVWSVVFLCVPHSETKIILSLLLRYKFKGHHCELKMSLFKGRNIWNYVYSPFLSQKIVIIYCNIIDLT